MQLIVTLPIAVQKVKRRPKQRTTAFTTCRLGKQMSLIPFDDQAADQEEMGLVCARGSEWLGQLARGPRVVEALSVCIQAGGVFCETWLLALGPDEDGYKRPNNTLKTNDHQPLPHPPHSTLSAGDQSSYQTR